jgi:hypothetical protein
MQDNSLISKFKALVVEAMLPIITEADKEKAYKAEETAYELVLTEQLNHVQVVQALSELMRTAKILKDKIWLVFFMARINRESSNSYQEFFWIIIESDVLFEATDISRIGRMIAGKLVEIGGAEIFRSYLVYVILTQEKDKLKNAVMAFLSVGHTMTSLRIVAQVVSQVEGFTSDLWLFVYFDAGRLVFREDTPVFSEEDKNYLKQFFTRGLTLPNKFIIEECQRSLERLAEI